MAATPNSPSTTPGTTPTPAPEREFREIKTDTQKEIDALKTTLEVDKPEEEKAFLKVAEFFKDKNEEIKKMTQEELDQLKKDIEDGNDNLQWTLKVTNGIVEFDEAAVTTPATTPPVTPPQTPQTPTDIPLRELNIPEDLTPPSREYTSKTTPTITDKILLFLGKLLGFGDYVRMWVMGYKNEKEMSYTTKSMENIQSISWSPISNIINLNDLSERDLKNVLSQFGELDFSIKENVEAAFLGKFGDNSKYKKYHKIYLGIETLAQEIKDNEELYDPVDRLTRLLQMSKSGIAPDYSTPEEPGTITPTAVPTEAERREQETQQKLSELDLAQKADKGLSDAEQWNPAGDPKIAEAQEKVDKIRNESKDRVIKSLTTVEEGLVAAEQELLVAQQEVARTGTIHTSSPTPQHEQSWKEAKEKVDQIQKRIDYYKGTPANAGVIANITEIAKKIAGDPLPLDRNTWTTKETSAKKCVELAQESEEEVKKVDTLMEAGQDAKIYTMTETEKKAQEVKASETKVLELAEKAGKLWEKESNKIDPEQLIIESKAMLEKIEADPNHDKIKTNPELVAMKDRIDRARNKFDLLKLIKFKISDKIGAIDWDDTDDSWVEHTGDDIQFDIISGFWQFWFANDYPALTKLNDSEMIAKFSNMDEIEKIIRTNKDYVRGTQRDPISPSSRKMNSETIIRLLKTP